MSREDLLSNLSKDLGRSPIREMFDEADRLERSGEDLIRLEVGEPDFDSPEGVMRGAREAMEEGKTHYTSNRGILELREEISNKLEDENGIRKDPESEIIVTAGGMEAIHISMLMTLDVGEEVLIPDPGWPNFPNHVMMAGGKPVRYRLTAENDFQIDLEGLKESINSDTKGILINTPSNPLGVVQEEEALRGVADLAADENLLIYADEAYESLTYGKEHVSIGSFDEVEDRVLTMQSFSKTYAMTGWRVGYVAGPEYIIDQIVKVRESTSSCTSSISQGAALGALRWEEESVERMRKAYMRRRDILMDEIESIPGVSCVKPEGAFYAFPDVSTLSGSSLEIAKDLLYEEGVVSVPGSGFGDTGEGFLRFSYANKDENVREGLERFHSFVDGR